MIAKGEFEVSMKPADFSVSGADELAGLRGTMKIVVEAAKHVFDFEFEL